MIAQHLRLYLHLVRFSFARALEFRLDFVFRILMDCLYYAVQLAFFGLLYRHTSLLGGWTLDQMIVFTATFLLVDAVNMTVLFSSLSVFPSVVSKGELDPILVRPVSALFFVSFRDFAASSFVNLVLAGGLLGWALRRYPGELDPARLLAFAVLLGVGLVVFYVIEVSFLIPVFWLDSGNATWELFHQVAKYAERPSQIYPQWLRRFLVTALPLGLVVSLPVQVLFEGLSMERALHAAAALAGSLAFLRWFWRKGLRAYGSAS